METEAFMEPFRAGKGRSVGRSGEGEDSPRPFSSTPEEYTELA